MNAIRLIRTNIYNYFQAHEACQKHFFAKENESQYVAYYNSMYLLDDSTESLLIHRSRGFSENSFSAYIEFGGIMQAIIIQQDAITEINNAITGKPLCAKKLNLVAWLKVRELRNICAGHPAKKAIPKTLPTVRTFMSRQFGNYDELTYECWDDTKGTTHPTVHLGQVFDD